jgi:hypothetical protein
MVQCMAGFVFFVLLLLLMVMVDQGRTIAVGGA